MHPDRDRRAYGERLLDGAHFEELAREAVAQRAPDPDLDAMVLVLNLIRVANRIGSDLEANVYRASGLSRAAFRALFAIWIAGPIAPNEIARLGNVTRPSVSSVLNTLERSGLIVRKRVSPDRRMIQVELTEQGQATVAELWVRNNERDRLWASALTPEQRDTLLGLLRILLRHHPPAGDGAPDPDQTMGGVES